MIKITKGFQKTITVSLKNASLNSDPVDLTSVTDIKATIESVDLTLGAGTDVLGSALLGKFQITLSTAQTDTLTVGAGVIQGQVEFGTSADPICFSINVEIAEPKA